VYPKQLEIFILEPVTKGWDLEYPLKGGLKWIFNLADSEIQLGRV
jgi:hypothetical protein